MSAWAVIPAKCFDRAKSRLEPVATAEERRKLAESMFRHVLGVAVKHPSITGVLVVTDCDEVEKAAFSLGAKVTRDARPGQLGATLDAALRDLPKDADAAVILMGDLPRLRAADLDELVPRLSKLGAVIAPDRVNEGTNALALRLPVPFMTAFGTFGSSSEHIRRFGQAGIAHGVHESPTVGFDVDSPEDLAAFRAES